jgi:Tol biopolymer transport system component
MRASLSLILLTTVAIVFGDAVGAQALKSSPEAMLRAAIDLETIAGDVVRASETYKKLLAMPAASASVRAQALVRLGDVSTKRGRSDDAQGYYRRVIQDFSDQASAVRLAQFRLDRGPTVKLSQRLVCEGTGCDGEPSPDGRLVVFREGNALRLRNLKTGELRNLAAPAAARVQAFAWTDDSRALAYGICEPPAQSNRCDYVIRMVSISEGKTSTIGNPSHSVLLAWSHDGQRVLTSTSSVDSENSSLEWVPVDGRARQPIAVVKGSVNAGAVSPDNRWIAFSYTASDGSDGLDAVATDGSQKRVVWSPHSAGYAAPVGWSSDGRYVFYTHAPSSLWAMRVDAGQPQGSPILIHRQDGARYSVSRSGTVMVRNVADGDFYTALLDLATGKTMSQPAPVGGASDSVPHYSPDGMALVYVKAPLGSPATIKIFRLGTNREESFRPQHNIAGAQIACWSADGRLVFNTSGAQIARVNIATREEVVVPGPPGNVFVTSCFGSTAAGIIAKGVIIKNLDDGSQRELYRSTTPDGLPLAPSLSRDGKLVAFYEKVNDTTLVVRVVSTEGGPSRELARAATVKYQAHRLTWSADNRYVYYSSATGPDRVETFRVEATGGTPQSTGFVGPGAGEIEVSPDGTRIVSRWGHPGETQIWTLENVLSQK